MVIDKDPWCCASDKLRIAVDGFDHGCLTTYKTMGYIVRVLPRDEALGIIDEMIVELASRLEPTAVPLRYQTKTTKSEVSQKELNTR